MKARILAEYYADAGHFVTKEESRYALDTLRIEPHPEEGVVIIATDGHTMGVFHDRGGTCPPEGITLRYVSALSDMCRPERTLEITADGAAEVINRNEIEVIFNSIESEGKFPSWQAVLPKWTDRVTRTDYNPEYIERCAKLCRAPYPHLAIWSGAEIPNSKNAEATPSVVRPYERDDCFFIVMPMRRNGDLDWPDLLDTFRPSYDPAADSPTGDTNGR